MKLFIDTANIDEIAEMNDIGVICGVTTNPTLIAKEGRIFHEVIGEIAEIVDGPISAEVISLKSQEMVQEAEELAKIHENIIVKIPMTIEGLKAVKILKAKKIKTNVTLVFSPAQALLAAKAGATYVSPFLGRLDDIGSDGLNLVKKIIEIFDNDEEISTQIIAASIRSVEHVSEVARLGCHIATVPYKILMQMHMHPLTDSGIEKFLNDWKSIETI